MHLQKAKKHAVIAVANLLQCRTGVAVQQFHRSIGGWGSPPISWLPAEESWVRYNTIYIPLMEREALWRSLRTICIISTYSHLSLHCGFIFLSVSTKQKSLPPDGTLEDTSFKLAYIMHALVQVSNETNPLPVTSWEISPIMDAIRNIIVELHQFSANWHWDRANRKST